MKVKQIYFILITALLLVCVNLSACQSNRSWSTGLYLKTSNGTHMLISENTPISLSDKTEDSNSFGGLSDGDKIMVLHDGIAESYPAQTGVYSIKKLSDGQPSDIPEEVINSLTELGWLKATADISPQPPQDEYEIVNIIDETKSGDLVTCDALEGFYSDGEYSYYFPSIKSHYITVYYKNGTEENICEALKHERVIIADLDRFEIGYYKEPLTENK
ncbi:MAG: hypothetical protein IJ499_03700 [Clostridia bacterium]|nr:hypothetical protein [Clostridia bacterium]